MQISVENYLVHHYPTIESFPTVAKKALFGTVKKIFHENQINTFLVENEHKDTFSFVEAIIDYFDIEITLKKNEMNHIPSYGKVVIIANHPLGALDALALIHLLKDVRKDIKIVAFVIARCYATQSMQTRPNFKYFKRYYPGYFTNH